MASASPAKMKVADLRAALAERGVSTAGLKAELVQRLERKMAEERRVDVPRGSFGLNSSTPPRTSTSGAPSTSGAAFGSPHRHHAEARVTLSPHRHHEQRRGLWGVPMSEAESREGDATRDRVLVLSSALREEQLVVARERDARLADRERRAEAEEALSHARARLQKHDEEVASLRKAIAHGRSENEAVAAQLTKAFADLRAERERRTTLESEVALLKQSLESRDGEIAVKMKEMQGLIDSAAEQRGRAETLRERLRETRDALANAETKLSVSAEALAEHKDRARALALHDPNPGIIQALENKLDELNAVTAALQAAASAAAEEAAERKSDAERADASLAAARETIETLESKVRHLEGTLAQSEASCLLHATELEQTRWREAAAGTHAAHAEEKAKALRDASAELERRADVAQRASVRDAGRAEAAEAALTRADDRARLAFEEKEKLAEEARIARAAAAAAALELRSIASDLAAAKATAAAQSARADDAETRATASDERFESLRRESSAAASRARDTSVALREAREKSAVLSTQVAAGETLVAQLEARAKQLEKRVKVAERAAKQTEARSREALATRDAENKKTLAETGSALAERAESIVAEAKRKAEAARKAEVTAKETLAETVAALKRRHAEALEKKRGKKKQYKSDLEHSRAVFERAREESRRAKASLVAANKLRESERSVAEAALARQAAEHETRAEALSTRVRELEAALKHAARDYKRVVSDVAPTKVALGRSEQTSEQIRLENLGLAQGLKRAEEAARTHERDAAEARRLLIEAERRFQLELEKNRRAWEQTSRGEYMGFDPYVDQGAVDGPKPGAAAGRAAKGDETIDDAPLYAGKGLDPSNVRPAGMSSEHLEAVARRERENAFHAKRQKDLGFGERAEYLDYDA